MIEYSMYVTESNYNRGIIMKDYKTINLRNVG